MFSSIIPWSRPLRSDLESRNASTLEDQFISGLEKLCNLATPQPGQVPQRVADERVQRVSAILNVLDARHGRTESNRWQHRPRTYIILWNIDGLEFMDKFVERHYTDFLLPYNNRTLPGFIQDSKMRERFLDVQSRLLTSVKQLESLSNSSASNQTLPHIHLDGSGDQHFGRINSLGQGGFGYVTLVLKFPPFLTNVVRLTKCGANSVWIDSLVNESSEVDKVPRRVEERKGILLKSSRT